MVLRRVADLLTTTVTASDSVARLGGEEFLLVMPGSDLAAAVRRCERVLRALREYPWHEVTRGLPVTASIGVTTVQGRATTASALLSEADAHLYAAKRAGRDRVVAGPMRHGPDGSRPAEAVPQPDAVSAGRGTSRARSNGARRAGAATSERRG
jgi:PleD family two-component response regulator